LEYIIVISSAGSGSTLLDKYLDSHPKELLANEILQQPVFTHEMKGKAQGGSASAAELNRILKRYKSGNAKQFIQPLNSSII
jgi:hypothetical protein